VKVLLYGCGEEETVLQSQTIELYLYLSFGGDGTNPTLAQAKEKQ
jgi:hypothetical protein